MVAPKTNALTELQQLKYAYCRAKYPHISEEDQVAMILSPTAKKYTDDSAYNLTNCIIDFIQYIGGYAVGLNTLNQKVVTTKGTASIHAIYQGRHLSIQVKPWQYIPSKEQEAVQLKVESAGGVYCIARDFQSFYNWFNTEIKKG